MYIERLDENRIRVTVAGADVKRWNVDLTSFTANTAEAQDLFWFALKQAEHEVDFRITQDSQLMVETMPNGDQGFYLYISVIKDEAELVSALIRSGKHAKQAEFKARRKARLRPLLSIFKFDNFDDVCHGIGEISELYVGKSRLIKYMGEFYLELAPPDSFGLFEIENILSEFSEKMKQPYSLQGILNEHGKTMIDADAIDIITRNFN